MKILLFCLIFILGILIGWSVRFLLMKAQRRTEKLNRYFLLDYAEKEIKGLYEIVGDGINFRKVPDLLNLVIFVRTTAGRLKHYIEKLKELN